MEPVKLKVKETPDVIWYQRGHQKGEQTGYAKGIQKQFRTQWMKLFGIVVLGSFFGHFVWALVGTFV